MTAACTPLRQVLDLLARPGTTLDSGERGYFDGRARRNERFLASAVPRFTLAGETPSESDGTEVVIPAERDYCEHDRDLYKARYLIENGFERLKGSYRAIAARYDYDRNDLSL